MVVSGAGDPSMVVSGAGDPVLIWGAGVRTDVDAQLGPVVEAGRRRGVPTPITAELHHSRGQDQRGFVVLERRWVVERSLGAFTHWGGLLRDRAGRLDVSAARLTCVAVMTAVQAIIDPMPRKEKIHETTQTGT